MPRSLVVSFVVAVAAISIVAAAFAATDREAALRGAQYISTVQESDGGFGGFGPGQTFDAVYAFRAAGIDPKTVTTGGNSPADFLRANLAEVSGSAGLAAKAALAALAMDLDLRNVDGTDLIAAIEGHYDHATGAYASDAFSQGLAILGLVCTDNDVPVGAVDNLRETQLDDGGWGFSDVGDPDATAIVVQALVAAGVEPSDGAVANAIAFFRETQAADAGWGFDPAESNANSTAYVIQALWAAGEDQTLQDFAVNGTTPMQFLLSLQQDDGSFPGFDPVFATNQAVPAIAGRTFCDAPVTQLEDVQLPEPATPEPDPTPVATPPAPAAPTTGTGLRGDGQLPLAGLGLAVIAIGAAAMFAAARRR